MVIKKKSLQNEKENQNIVIAKSMEDYVSITEMNIVEKLNGIKKYLTFTLN